MKKTRILAALLCVMMVVCALPMMASAAPTAAELTSLGAILGGTSALPVSGLDFQFANNFDSTMTYVTTPAGAEYDSTNGLDLTEITVATGSASWRYKPSNGWSVFSYGALAFRSKVNAGGTLNFQAYYVDGNGAHARVYFNVSETGVTVSKVSWGRVTNEFDFAPGTDWADYLLKQNDDKGYSLYVKAASTNNAWKLLATVGGTESLTGSNATGIAFYSTDEATTHTGGYVQYATVYAASDIPVYDSIQEMMGVDYVAPGSMNLDFTTDYTPSKEVIVSPGSVQYLENGMTFPVGTTSTWYYTPGTDYTSLTGPKGTGTSPLTTSTVGVARIKLASTTDSINIQFNNPNTTAGRMYADVTASKITMYGGDSSSSANNTSVSTTWGLGTDWADVAFVPGASSYKIFVKSATTGNIWKMVGESTGATGYRQGRTYGMGFSTTAKTGVYVKSFIVYRQAGPQYDSIADIVGSEVATEQNFVFDSKFVKGLTFIDAQNKTVGMISPEGASYTDANGLDMSSASNPTWTYLPFNGYQAFNNGYKKSIIAFTAKATATTNGCLQWKSLDSTGRVYINLNTNDIAPYSGGTKTVYSSVVPGTDWVDYLVVPHTEDYGYSIYMKSDSLTGGKWELKVSCNDDQGTSNYNGIGIQIYGAVNQYKNLRVLSTTGAVAESATKPADATQLMYEENFGVAPTYTNVSAQGTQIADGYANLTSTQEEEGKVVLYNGGIPAGGYAEFKVKNAATSAYYRFYDGTKAYQIEDIKSYGSVPSDGLYISDAGNVWRTFRVVRNSDGTYSAYTKVDDEENWLKLSVNVDGMTSDATEQASFAFSAHANGTDGGAGVIDYLKIYGPAISAPLTITDGYGTKIVADGEAVTYEETLRYIVNGTSGKLLVVSYAGDNMLKAQIVDVASMADDSAIVNAKADGATKVKVFLWDSFAKLNRQTPAVTLNL